MFSREVNENKASQELTSMQTLHIINSYQRNKMFEPNVIKEQNDLMMVLYHEHLKSDPLFHFFYEPDIIIRISSDDVLNKIGEYLSAKNIKFVIYDYPSPPPSVSNRVYGENPDGIVIRNLALFLPIFHAHSVAALSLNAEDHFSYMERVVHTMWNPRGYSREEEGEYLATLAEFKLGKPVLPRELDEKMQSKMRCNIL